MGGFVDATHVCCQFAYRSYIAGRARLVGVNFWRPSKGKSADIKMPTERLPERPSMASSTLGKMTLPPGAVVVLVQDVKDALALLPKMILLAPEEYQKLLDRMSTLETKLKGEKRAAHACKLTGRVEAGFAIVRRNLFSRPTNRRARFFWAFRPPNSRMKGALTATFHTWISVTTVFTSKLQKKERTIFY